MKFFALRTHSFIPFCPIQYCKTLCYCSSKFRKTTQTCRSKNRLHGQEGIVCRKSIARETTLGEYVQLERTSNSQNGRKSQINS